MWVSVVGFDGYLFCHVTMNYRRSARCWNFSTVSEPI